jgi:tripartite-type tricarboxylate transporter receptor subunit TctC
MTRRHCRLLALCIVAGACLSQAKADGVAEFYKGKAVTVVVSSNAAGGYDTFARAVGQAHSGQSGCDRAQHAGRGRHDRHEFSLQQCR